MNESAAALTLLVMVPVMVPVVLIGRRFIRFVTGLKEDNIRPTRTELLWTAGAMLILVLNFAVILAIDGGVELVIPIVICSVIAGRAIMAARKAQGS